MSIKSTKLSNLIFISYLNYFTTGIIIILGFTVKSFSAGSACGAHWPLCPAIFTEPNIKVYLEFSHRFFTLLGIVLFVFQLFLAIRAKASKIFYWFKIIGILLLIESLIGAVIVIFKLPDSVLNLHKTILYLIHPIVSILLFASLGLICAQLKQNLSVKDKLGWLMFLIAMMVTGALNSLVLNDKHVFILSRLEVLLIYLSKPYLFLHPFLGLVGLIIALKHSNLKFVYSLFTALLTGFLIPIFHIKVISIIHFFSFLLVVHYLIFSKK